ncbi:hypothetical protein HB838_11970 [Listeria seeligeri]|uniref:DUF5986 family protein n=1 Tax=Listeria seeligeri TaxID=1640 RepID=UPI001629C289|nr:DUF5986 family protein [Listeria seeligeri]MBC1757878.1 hypothetical protein [Listeria seeligeri]MBC1816608.1 hypothetical protein [Listeria seeligeri]MBC2030869.1 hypothetical protein [Listeria seeligeri]MBC6115561.1 hypothetical protein [Listeria seeligeri]MBC6160994.1 hypothetical protein [Listeria seeligeri]
MDVATSKEQVIIDGILHAMSITEKDVVDDFKGSISKTNKNGLSFNVWARRSDDLESQFAKHDDIEVFHIKRTKLWQIDAVFDRETGNIYLLFSDTTLSQVRNKYMKKGKSTHYSYSFLLKNIGLLPIDGEAVELIPYTDEEIEILNLRRQKDIEKMLGNNAENVKKVIMVSVSYHEGEAIAALLQEYTSNYELSSEKDVSFMLNTAYSGDGAMYDDGIQPMESEQSLVTLKSIKKAE